MTRAITGKVPFEKLVNIKEITLDLANNMDWIEKVESTGLVEMKVAAQTIKRHI